MRDGEKGMRLLLKGGILVVCSFAGCMVLVLERRLVDSAT